MIKIRLKDLLIKTNFKKVWKVLKKLYPKSHKTSYILTWMELLNVKRIPKNKEAMIIRITKTYEKSEKKYWYRVDAVNKEEPNGWALDFNSFCVWLSYYISEDVLEKYTIEEIFAHCLWEMTFNGYSNKTICNIKKNLMDQLKKIK